MDSKAVSPVISTTMMILLMTIIVASMYSWSGGILKEMQDAATIGQARSSLTSMDLAIKGVVRSNVGSVRVVEGTLLEGTDFDAANNSITYSRLSPQKFFPHIALADGNITINDNKFGVILIRFNEKSNIYVGSMPMGGSYLNVIQIKYTNVDLQLGGSWATHSQRQIFRKTGYSGNTIIVEGEAS